MQWVSQKNDEAARFNDRSRGIILLRFTPAGSKKPPTVAGQTPGILEPDARSRQESRVGWPARSREHSFRERSQNLGVPGASPPAHTDRLAGFSVSTVGEERKLLLASSGFSSWGLSIRLTIDYGEEQKGINGGAG